MRVSTGGRIVGQRSPCTRQPSLFPHERTLRTLSHHAHTAHTARHDGLERLSDAHTAHRAELSRAFVRTRLAEQRAQLSEEEQALLAAPHSSGSGLVERQFWTLGFGNTAFANGAGDVVDTPGHAMAVATEDVVAMGDRGPSTFFVPTLASNFVPAHPPRLAPATAPQPSAATPTRRRGASRRDGTRWIGGGRHTGSGHHDDGGTARHGHRIATRLVAWHAPHAIRGSPSQHAAGQCRLRRDFRCGSTRKTSVPVPALHAACTPPSTSRHGARPRSVPQRTPRVPAAPSRMNAMDQQFHHVMSGPVPGQAGRGGSPNGVAPSPTPSFAARNPSPHARTSRSLPTGALRHLPFRPSGAKRMNKRPWPLFSPARTARAATSPRTP